MTGGEDGLAGEGACDGLMGGEAVEAAGADDVADQGMDVGPPGRAEAVRHLAEDHAGAQRALGRVVGRRRVARSWR